MDLETGKYLAEKSNELLDKQIQVYREKRSISATIIGLNTLFIPFFLAGIGDSELWIKFLVLFPILMFSIALFFLLKIYALKSLERGLAIANYDETIRKTFEEALLKEIAVNRDSYLSNSPILKRLDIYYNRGMTLTQIAISVSIILLTLNLFFEPEKQLLKVEIINTEIMSNKPTKDENVNKPTPPKETQNEPVIPTTQPKDREKLTEGKQPK